MRATGIEPVTPCLSKDLSHAGNNDITKEKPVSMGFQTVSNWPHLV